MTNYDEDAVGALLRRAGRREQPGAEASARVYAASRAVWQQELQLGYRRRQWLASAAGIALAALGFMLWIGSRPSSVTHVAQVVRSSTGVRMVRAGQDLRVPTAGLELQGGDQIITSAAGSLVAQRADGVSVRIDGNTRLQWTLPEEIELSRGRIYIDSGSSAVSQRDTLTLITPMARVRHLGTQFSVTASAAQLRVAVRDGLVEVLPEGAAAVRVGRGEALERTAKGELRRMRTLSGDSEWGWVDSLAPAVVIEGRSLFEVLTELAREAGLQLQFDSNGAEQATHATRLNGAPLNLPPRAAIEAILVATSLEATIRDEFLVVRNRS